MGPGPSDVPPRVLEALSRPTIGHLDPRFVEMMDDLKELLQYAFQTENALTLPISGPASAAMETCFVNLIEPGDKVVVCVNGVFGGRMRENVERCGATPVLVLDDWGRPVDPAKVEDALRANPDAKALAFVHAETSTGAQSDASTLAGLARRHDCLTIVDTVTSLGGTPVLVDQWGLDAVYSGSQKCLSCTPGLAPVTFSERAVQAIQKRKGKIQSWFMDLNLVMQYWGQGAQRAYHHTAPVNALYGLHEALLMLREEGLEQAWERHRRNHEALKAGLRAMGLEFLVDANARLPQLNAVWIPEGIDDRGVRCRLLEEFSLEIGAGLGDFGGRVWRIGLMGAASAPRNVILCLGALEAVLGEQRVSASGEGGAIWAAQRAYAA
jgi:alanine-glyoxylate transaminase/serine-glyoxylate transaminase/serine-pyruvate transaminase